MKIMLTGAAGFIGSSIADEYIIKNHDVVILDDLSSGKKEYINPKAKFYQVDIRNTEEIKTIFTKEKPDILNHHAAQMNIRKSVDNPQFDARINILGLLNLLESGVKNGLKKVIFASSGGAVYGDAKIIPTPEDYEPKTPLSPYGVTKYASELYLYFYFKSYDIPYIALRYSNVYGPRQNPHGEAGVVAIFSKSLVKNTPPVINGDGLQTRDYIFIKDVVEANIKALSSKFIGSLNIATSGQTDVLTIFQKLKSISGKNLNPKFGPPKKGEQRKSSLDITRAKEILNWSPQITLDQGLQNTLRYFSHNL